MVEKVNKIDNIEIIDKINKINELIESINSKESASIDEIIDISSQQADLISIFLQEFDVAKKVQMSNLKFINDLVKIIDKGYKNTDGNVVVTFSKEEVDNLKDILKQSIMLRMKEE